MIQIDHAMSAHCDLSEFVSRVSLVSLVYVSKSVFLFVFRIVCAFVFVVCFSFSRVFFVSGSGVSEGACVSLLRPLRVRVCEAPTPDLHGVVHDDGADLP